MPFIVRWPGKVAANKIDNQSMMSAVDLLPTFCEIAGAKLPSSYKPDGVSQVSTFKGQPTRNRSKPLFWKMVGRRGQPGAVDAFHWVDYCIVDDKWKLLADEATPYVELYDIMNDPYEKTDLKDRHPEIVLELKKELTAWRETLPAKPDSKTFSSLRQK